MQVTPLQVRFNHWLDLICGPAMNTDSPESLAARESDSNGLFPASEYIARCAALQKLLREEDISGVLLCQQEDVEYFTGYLSVLWISKFRPLGAIISADPDTPPCLLLPTQERTNADRTSWINEVSIFPAQEPPEPHIVEQLRLRNLGNARIGIEAGFGQRLGMNILQFQNLTEILSQAEFVDASPLLAAVRMIKSQGEVGYLREACEISQRALEVGFSGLKPGQTERELATSIAQSMFTFGAEVGCRAPVVAVVAGDGWSGSNSVASDRPLSTDDWILIDGGANYRGYCCDFIRQAYIGNPNSHHSALFEVVREANAAAVEAIKPGVAAHTVYEAAVEVLRQHRVDQQNRLNIIGHGIGLDIHELPWLGERDRVYTSDVHLRPGMVLAIEPGIRDETGYGHFIVENMVVVTDHGAETLTATLSDKLWLAA